MRLHLPSARLALASLLLAAGGAGAQDLVRPPDRGEIRAFPFRQTSTTEELPLAAIPSSPPLKLAPRNAKAANDRPQRPAPATPGTAIGTVVSSLAIVLGLLLGLVWCSRRFAPTGTAPLPKEAVELLGRSPLNARQMMQLLRVGDRLLLVAISAGGVQTLTEITDPEEVEQLVALCRRGQADSASASFDRVIREMASEPVDRGGRSRQRGAV